MDSGTIARVDVFAPLCCSCCVYCFSMAMFATSFYVHLLNVLASLAPPRLIAAFNISYFPPLL